MIALPKSFMRALMATLLLLTLFTQTDAYAQATRAVAPPTTDLRPPPPPPSDPPYNNAAFSGQSVPTTMTAGQVYTVTVNMRNNGTTTWISEESYNLGSRNPYDNLTWGGGRVAVAGSIPPGANATFTFTVTAPSSPGSYNFQWAMVQDGVEWFGPPSDNVVVNVVAPARVNNAVIVAQNVPAQMVSGQSYPVTMVMQNTGNTTWTTADQYSFGIPTTNGVQLWNGGRVPLPGPVGPGGQVTFNFNVTAPAPGSYSFFGLMVQDGVEFFGQGSNIPVSVSAPPTNGAAFVNQSVPGTMVPGQAYGVSVTMQNTGNTTWTSGQSYRLGSSNPLGNGTWTTTRVELPGNVAPGQNATFNFQVVAPSTPGSYNFEWRMLREGVEWFGAASQTMAVSVAAPPQNNAGFVSQTVPATMLPGQPYSVTVVMQNTGTSTWTAHGDKGLASANPLANNTWSAVRIDQPATTAPGQTASYTFQVTAPVTPGAYNFQWKMVQDGVEWFGTASPNLSIQVAPPADNVTYIHTDGLGSPVARSDSAGNVISRTSYEPYGRTAGGVTPTIGFTGHVNDADTGLVYMQQRYYDPVAGRFLSVDPVTTDANTGGGFNRYVYANSSPYQYMDLDGRDPKAISIVAAAHKGEWGWGKPGWQGPLRFWPAFKCSIFVNEVIRAAGDDPPMVNGRPALAGELADKNLLINNWIVVTDGTLKDGDIIAEQEANDGTYTGHAGIVKHGGAGELTISANSGTGTITHNDWGSRSGQDPTIRRYIPGQGHREDPSTKPKPKKDPPPQPRPGHE